MNRLAFAMLATAGFAWTPAFAAISPTGVADTDTAAIQQAIDDAPNGTVTLASGKFALNKAIMISNGASLVGGGAVPGDVILELVDNATTNVIRIASSGSTIVSNLTVTAGYDALSGIVMNSGLVIDCVIRDIKTKNGKSHGGGVNMSGGTVRGCTITKCEAYNSGGNLGAGEAIYMTGGLVENCTIVSNAVTYTCGSHDWAGGTVYMSGGTLRGCLIADNVGDRNASGVAVQDGIVESCTIAGNHQHVASSDANGIWVKVKQNGNVVLRNNIVWGNTAFDGSVANFYFDNSGAYAFEYNDTKPLLSVGTGNISVDPEFVDAANCNYHTGYSYCSDTGFNQDWMTGAVDLDGNARIRDGNVDMGCYEGETPSGFACRMSMTSDEAPNLATVTLACECTVGTVDYAEWTFTRQEDMVQAFAHGPSTSIQLGPGTWNVHLVVSSGQQSAPLDKTGAIVVQSTRVYANAKGRGEFPYDTVEKGLPSICDALQALGVGGTLYVAAGNYVISNGLNLVEGRGSRIVSLEGPENTIVRLADVANFNNDNGEYGLNLACDTAYVEGLTFVGGVSGPYYTGTEYKSRGLLKSNAAGAVVTNCVFRDIRGRDRKWGCGLDISKGTVVDCLFSHINSFSSGGAMPQGGSFIIQGGLVDRTRIVDCLALASDTGAGGNGDVIGVWGSGVLRNSLVTRCSSEHDTPIYVGGGPGASTGGYLENCTIVANTNLFADVKDGLWYAAGVVVSGGSITNCIIVDNWSVHGNAVSNIYNEAGAAGIGYTLVNDRAGDATFVTAENHNIAVQPSANVFRRPAKGDYALATGSPAINSGLKFDWMDTASDLSGSPRIVSRVPDMGCYESKPSHFCIRIR